MATSKKPSQDRPKVKLKAPAPVSPLVKVGEPQAISPMTPGAVARLAAIRKALGN